MKSIYLIPALVAAGLLSACSTSSSTPGTPGTPGGPAAGAPGQLEGAMALRDSFVSDFATVGNVDNLSHTASMNGYLLARNDNVSFIGDASADFNFASSTISGAAKNFNQYGDFWAEDPAHISALDGSLGITGRIENAGFNYSVNGQLTGIHEEHTSGLTANVSLDGDGSFFTDGHGMAALGVGHGGGDLFDNEAGYLEQFDLMHMLVLRE